MARTSASMGMGISVTILGILTFAGFISTLVFFGQKQKAEREYNDLSSQIADFVATDEQQREFFRVRCQAVDHVARGGLDGVLPPSLAELLGVGVTLVREDNSSRIVDDRP